MFVCFRFIDLPLSASGVSTEQILVIISVLRPEFFVCSRLRQPTVE